MNCQNCDAVVAADAEQCEKCGARLLLKRRVIFGAPSAAEFRLTSEAAPVEIDEPAKEDPEWQFPAPTELPEVVAPALTPSAAAPAPQYGGFFRRLGAFAIDWLMIGMFATLMALMAWIGYKVGLAAHGRMFSYDKARPLVVMLVFGWLLLATAYFVMFHGMEGKTIGKWLFGLRVVSAERRTISSRRALLRWIGSMGFGCATFGLSFLWILWSSEKRGWHDFLARTWVIRD
ncbi:MAG: RDD family protein [Deltaproteobacteria bacterium]|nr:RDD family protein [Deltaproteobacteria bacterium]